MTPVTQREFAQMKGVTPEAVRQAIISGRLRDCLVMVEGYKKPRIDPVKAAQEWERNTNHAMRNHGPDIRPRVPAPKPPEISSAETTIHQSRAIHEAYKARLAKLEYEERSGKLVDVTTVKNEAFKRARIVRDNLLNIPDRVSAEIAGMTNAFDINSRLTQEIMKVLEMLSTGEGEG